MHSLFDDRSPRGQTFDPALDGPRTLTQQAAVMQVMAKGAWVTLDALAEQVGALTGKKISGSGLTARIRECRAEPHCWRIESERHYESGPESGVWRYRRVL